MASTSPQTTNSGIVIDDASGERHIPESTRPDGTTRKAIKIRPGYRPPEDVAVYKNRTAEAFRERGKRVGIPGAAGLKDDENKDEAEGSSSTGAANKNAKRREARKKAKAAAEEGKAETNETAATAATPDKKGEEVDPEAEKLKKVRNLRKKLKQAKDLKNKKEEGEALLPEQIAKVIKINELIRELDSLGFDTEGEPKEDGEKDTTDGKK